MLPQIQIGRSVKKTTGTARPIGSEGRRPIVEIEISAKLIDRLEVEDLGKIGEEEHLCPSPYC
jgi:hypothetical protein